VRVLVSEGQGLKRKDGAGRGHGVADAEQHQASRWIAEPLHLLDCCQESDGGVAMVVTSVERARDLRQRPVVVRGMAGGELVIDGDAGCRVAAGMTGGEIIVRGSAGAEVAAGADGARAAPRLVGAADTLAAFLEPRRH